MTDEEFGVKVESAKILIGEKDTTLEKHTQRMWSQIVTQRLNFRLQAEELEVLGNLTRQEFVNHFEDKFFESPRIMEVNLVSQKKLEEQKQIQIEKVDKIYEERGISLLNVGSQSLRKMKSQLPLHPDPFKNLLEQ